MIWCQRSRRRILAARMKPVDYPVLTLVKDTLCTGLALDVINGDAYWTSASGHLVFRASYTAYNTSYARERHPSPVYILADPEYSAPVHNNQTVVTAVSADGLAGDFGKNPRVMPVLLSAVGSDPDNGDAEFGNGDRLLLQFDRPTNVSLDILAEGEQGQGYVDSLFAVSKPLGSQYSGLWLDASTFRIDVQNAWLPRPQINGTTYTTRVWLPPTTPLLSADGSLPVYGVSPSDAIRLAGSLGTHAKPRLLTVVGSDPDNGDDSFSTHDTITLTFDKATHIGRLGSQGSTDRFKSGANGGGIELDQQGVDALFRFDFYLPGEAASRVPSLGLDYKGSWTDDSTFVITVVNGIRRVGRDDQQRVWARMPLINTDDYMADNYQAADSIWVDVLADVRSLGLQSPRCNDRVPLTGDWGTRTQKPNLAKIFGVDPDNGDTLPSPGDTLTIVFDRRTSKGRTARPPPPDPGTKEYADFFLRFDPIIGFDYTALFTDDSTLVLTVNDGNEEWVQGGTIRIKPQAQIKNYAATSDPANDEFELPPAIWGNPGSPSLLSAKVHDYDNFNTAWSGEDVITLAFDRSTDHGKAGLSGGREYVDTLFAFDHWLGDDYSGAWTDTSVFAITAIDVNVERPAVGRSSVSSSRQILNAGATATCCAGNVPISGSFGAAASVPRLVSFEASDPLSKTDGPTNGETIQAVFDIPTDRAYGTPLAEIFTFIPPLPVDMAMRWADASTFELIIGPSGAGPGGQSLLLGGTTIMLHAGKIRAERLALALAGQPSALETYAVETNMSLGGSFGTTDPPKLVSFIPFDAANADTHFGDGDRLVLGFDVHTTESGQLNNKLSVDSIFGFSSSLGTDYTGEWSECYDEVNIRECKTFTITIVDATMPSAGDIPPVIGRTLAWSKPPDPDPTDSDQPPNFAGILSASELSTPSLSAITLGSSEHSEPEPIQPVLDIGQQRILFLQRTSQPGGVTPVPREVATQRNASAVAAAAAANAEAEKVVNAGDLVETYRSLPYGAANGLRVRLCPLDKRVEPQAHMMQGGQRVTAGSCSGSDELPPMHLTSGYLAGGGCGEGGGGCGASVQFSALRPMLVRPPGAPIEGNAPVNILGAQLSSVRMCQFMAEDMPYGQGLAIVRPYDAAGFSCVAPEFNASLLRGYDRGAVSQTITLRLSEDGERFFDSHLRFVYYRQPMLTGAKPLGGPSIGATVVLHGVGLHAVHADPSAARCRLGKLVTAVSAISASGHRLTCVLPPLPPHFTLGVGYPLAVAIDGSTFIDDPSVGSFSYYTPPSNASMQPISGGSEAGVEVVVYASGLDNFEGGEKRCRFGVAGSSPAQLVTVPSSDPLRPELSHVELRCRAPPCMRFGCMGTAEVMLSLNGIDYSGFGPPLLYQYRNEFVLHVWGCDESVASAASRGVTTPCGEAIVQRATSLSSVQHSLSVRRDQLTELLELKVRPARVAADEALAARENDRHSTSWELHQARRDANLAHAREREEDAGLTTMQSLKLWTSFECSLSCCCCLHALTTLLFGFSRGSVEPDHDGSGSLGGGGDYSEAASQVARPSRSGLARQARVLGGQQRASPRSLWARFRPQSSPEAAGSGLTARWPLFAPPYRSALLDGTGGERCL